MPATASTLVERKQYAQELAAYTLRQFSSAGTTLDQHQAAAAKLPALHKRHLASLKLAGRNDDPASKIQTIAT